MTSVILRHKIGDFTKQLRLVKFYDQPKGNCNLCGKIFDLKSRHHRFCETCREGSDIYRYAEWAIYS